MIDLGNGQYQISNKSTGQTKTVSAADLPKYGLSAPTATQPQDKIPGIVKAAAPVIGGGLGAAAGSVGGPVGSLGMGSLGAMGGQSLMNLIERLTGGPAPENIQQNAESLRNAGGAQLAGEGIGRAAGFLANPIRGLGSMVDEILGGSNKAINLDELLNMFKGNLPKTVGEMAGKGPETQTALNELSTRLGQMVHARLPYEGASSNVPVAVANDIKRAIPNLGNLLGSQGGGATVADMYGGLSAPGFEVPKAFGSTLRDAIAQAEPGVKFPNAAMHALYQVPDLLSGLTYLLGRRGGQAARMIGGSVAQIPGKIIPEGGGLLKYLLQLGLQGAQQAQ